MDHSEDTAEEPRQTGGTSDQGGGSEETPIDPSLNAGRDAFGDVSDFGLREEPTDQERGSAGVIPDSAAADEAG